VNDSGSEGTRHERATEWFAELANLPANESEDRLKELRLIDPDVAAEVEALLQVDRRASVLDQGPDLANGPTPSEARSDVADAGGIDGKNTNAQGTGPRAAALHVRGRSIGPFEIIEELGRGGMGVVYRARQKSPNREVALKLVRANLLMPDATRRLETEADVLARMTHPGIARVYEAGNLDDGDSEVSYFAMELVEGETLVRHAESHRLSIPDRVRTIVEVCDAVQHAHQRGVIHRDLKPANILVDDDGHPRVLDFGIARLVETSTRLTTVERAPGALAGTLSYMSPEQLTGDAGEIDTRTDVYALGAVLYELLTGRPPIVVEGMPLTRALETLRTERPKRPRSVDPRISRDLELIVLKAIDADPDRRYGSASTLAADLRRYLARLPVEARPATARYRFQRFAQRNPGLCAGLGIAAVAATAGLAGIAWGYAESVRRVSALEVANAETIAEAQRADAVNEFLRRMLVSADPLGETGRGRADMTVVEILDRETGQIASAFSGLPASEASVRGTIGSVYLSLGRFDKAEPHLRRAVELHEDVYGDRSSEADRPRRDLAVLLNETGRQEEAIEIFEAILQRQTAEGRDDGLEFALTASRYGGTLLENREFELAERWLSRAANLFDRQDFGRNDALPSVLNNIARARSGMGDAAGAETMYTEARDAFVELHGSNHPSVAIADQNIATLRYARADYEGAAESYRRVVGVLGPLMGETHPTVATIRHNLAFALYELERYAESFRELSTAADAYVEHYGDDHVQTLGTRMAAADALLKLERFDDAAETFADIASRWEAMSPDDARAQRARFYSGVAMVELGEVAEGETHMASARDRFVELDSVDSPTGQRLTRELAEHMLGQGRVAEARELASELDPSSEANRPLLLRLSGSEAG
jgi:tetratricopeptide (TPR) repeat protein/predicted Ser/Thr protein kinase